MPPLITVIAFKISISIAGFVGEIVGVKKVTSEDIKKVANNIFTEENCSVLYYMAKK